MDLKSIRITAYNGLSGESSRFNRLEQTLAFAAGAASQKHRIPSRVFLRHILAVHDHKGWLSVLWDSHDAADTFGELLADAWEEQAEVAEFVGHFVDNRFVSRGRQKIMEECEEWPDDDYPDSGEVRS